MIARKETSFPGRITLKGKKYQDRRVEGEQWKGLGQMVKAIKKGWAPPAADPPSHEK